MSKKTLENSIKAFSKKLFNLWDRLCYDLRPKEPIKRKGYILESLCIEETRS